MEFGAAWKKTSGEGREYLSVKLDDPSFPAPIYATLIEADEPGDLQPHMVPPQRRLTRSTASHRKVRGGLYQRPQAVTDAQRRSVIDLIRLLSLMNAFHAVQQASTISS